MIDFTDISYLREGTVIQQEVYNLLDKYGIWDILQPYDPILVGTYPLDIQVKSSDLDIVCYAPDLKAFEQFLKEKFSGESNFTLMEKTIIGRPSIIAGFRLEGFEMEIFGQSISTRKQMGYLHLVKEYEILQKKGYQFKEQVIELKKQGYKTEPAFARLLGIEGDPYQGLLEYRIL